VGGLDVGQALAGICVRLFQVLEDEPLWGPDGLAARGGFCGEHLIELAQGERDLDVDMLVRVCQASGVSADWILAGERTVPEEEAALALGVNPEASPASAGSKSAFRKKKGGAGLERLFPWVAYDEEGRLYLNGDDTVGFLWECAAGSSARRAATWAWDAWARGPVHELLTRKTIPGTVWQFIFSARAVASGAPPEVKLFFSVKTPAGVGLGRDLGDRWAETRKAFSESGLRVKNVPPEGLLGWLRSMCGFTAGGRIQAVWNPFRELRRQVLTGGARLEAGKGRVDLVWPEGGRPVRFRCVTPKVLSEAGLGVDVPGLTSLAEGAPPGAGVLYAAGIVVKEGVQPGEPDPGSPERLVRVVPISWVWAEDDAWVQRAAEEVKRLFASRGSIMQHDQADHPALFLAALPFGLATGGGSLATLDRDFEVPAEVALRLAPVRDLNTASALRGALKRPGMPLGWEGIASGVKERVRALLSAARGDAAENHGSTSHALSKIPSELIRSLLAEGEPPTVEAILEISRACNSWPSRLLFGERTLPVRQAALEAGLGPEPEPWLAGETHKVSDLARTDGHAKFSDYLPWIRYDEKSRCYENWDSTVGFLWECVPKAFSFGREDVLIEGLFRLRLPTGTIFQFILYGDDNVEEILAGYRSGKPMAATDVLARKIVDRFTEYLRQGVRGEERLSGIPVRNFRLFVSLKMDSAKARELDLTQVREEVQEKLESAAFYPRPLDPGGMIGWVRRVLNDVRAEDSTWCRYREIRKQVLLAETSLRKEYRKLRMEYAGGGSRIFRCITPKAFPKKIDRLQMNELFGGVWGIDSDKDQVQGPFLYTLNVVVDEGLRQKLHTKCNVVLSQRSVGSLAMTLERKKEEYQWATDLIEAGKSFCRVLPVFWVWGEEDRTREVLNRVKSIWEGKGFIMQQDVGILPILLLAALPFGLYSSGRNLDTLERDFIIPASLVPRIAPLQADFRGVGDPQTIFVGRKGQLATLDVFADFSAKQNGLVLAGSGGGKSFLVNYLAYNCYMAGSKVRIVDIGKSYKKLVKLAAGRFIDFEDRCRESLNPFTMLRPEEFATEVTLIAELVMQMAYSSTGEIPAESGEDELKLLKRAVQWAYREEGNDAELKTVDRYLREFPAHEEVADFREPGHGREAQGEKRIRERLVGLARGLSWKITDFVDGQYKDWFNGRSRFDIQTDRFVVLELEGLKRQMDLFRVVTLQVLNNVTRDLYLGDPSVSKFIVFDEAHQFLQAGACSKMGKTIEEGYRRARKHKGAFYIVSQSLTDLAAFGAVGEVIRDNAEFRFYLESTAFDRALDQKLISFNEFEMKILKSVRSMKRRYSEIFVDTPYGMGVVRLLVDPYSYLVYSSDPRDVVALEGLVERGMGYDEAIDLLVAGEERQRKAAGAC
jgi:conjugal transfer ATP-binding protein TraC